MISTTAPLAQTLERGMERYGLREHDRLVARELLASPDCARCDNAARVGISEATFRNRMIRLHRATDTGTTLGSILRLLAAGADTAESVPT